MPKLVAVLARLLGYDGCSSVSPITLGASGEANPDTRVTMRRSDSRTSLAGDLLSNRILYRSAALGTGEGRTIHGLAVPYESITTISERDDRGQIVEFREKFTYGSFARSIKERGHKVMLLVGHDHRKLPVGRAVQLEEQRDGLHAAFEVSDTTLGNDLLTLVRDGIADSFSIGFTAIRERWEGDLRIHHEAGLREVSAVTWPAYPGAAIAGVRSQSQLVIPRSVAERRLRLLEL
jgi:HK97 family phage prohead protease